MDAIPKDLADLLQEHHRSVWEPKFRKYLADMDKKVPSKAWRVTLLDFVLKCREIKSLQTLDTDRKQTRGKTVKRTNSSSSSSDSDFDGENLANERDQLLEQLCSSYLSENSKEKVGLSDTNLRTRILQHHSNRQQDKEQEKKLYEDVWQAHQDQLVWPKLDKLCSKFLKEAAARPALAVLLSIL